jgi:hypothetical protein
MKHLKTKKIFEALNYDECRVSHDEIEDVKDILLELNDKGYYTQVTWMSYENQDGAGPPGPKSVKLPMLNGYYYITIKKGSLTQVLNRDDEDYALFRYSDVKEVVDRIREYMGNKVSTINIVDEGWKMYNITWFKQRSTIYRSEEDADMIRNVIIELK